MSDVDDTVDQAADHSVDRTADQTAGHTVDLTMVTRADFIHTKY